MLTDLQWRFLYRFADIAAETPDGNWLIDDATHQRTIVYEDTGFHVVNGLPEIPGPQMLRVPANCIGPYSPPLQSMVRYKTHTMITQYERWSPPVATWRGNGKVIRDYLIDTMMQDVSAVVLSVEFGTTAKMMERASSINPATWPYWIQFTNPPKKPRLYEYHLRAQQVSAALIDAEAIIYFPETSEEPIRVSYPGDRLDAYMMQMRRA